jgi:hypothetical protein
LRTRSTVAASASAGTSRRPARPEITLRGVNARVPGVFDVTFDDGRRRSRRSRASTRATPSACRRSASTCSACRSAGARSSPSPGAYDRAYLDRIAAVVALAARAASWCCSTFHQDAFSKEIGQDGAPRWVLDPPARPGNYPTWAAARGSRVAPLRPATLEPFRQLLRTPTDVQDAFAAAAAVVARRFRASAAVVGYEIMNEPLVLSWRRRTAAARLPRARREPRSARSTRAT